jgi:hypothetical protein
LSFYAIYLQGHEQELFARLAKKYGTSNPLHNLSDPFGNASGPTQDSTAMMSPFMQSANNSNQHHAATPMSSTQEGLTSSIIVASSPFPSMSASSLGSSSTPSLTFSSAQSPFGQTSAIGGSSSSTFNGMPNATGPTFGGKSPRELLTAFYREKNPSKISDVDTLLLKYQV